MTFLTKTMRDEFAGPSGIDDVSNGHQCIIHLYKQVRCTHVGTGKKGIMSHIEIHLGNPINMKYLTDFPSLKPQCFPMLV